MRWGPRAWTARTKGCLRFSRIFAKTYLRWSSTSLWILARFKIDFSTKTVYMSRMREKYGRQITTSIATFPNHVCAIPVATTRIESWTHHDFATAEWFNGIPRGLWRDKLIQFAVSGSKVVLRTLMSGLSLCCKSAGLHITWILTENRFGSLMLRRQQLHTPKCYCSTCLWI